MLAAQPLVEVHTYSEPEAFSSVNLGCPNYPLGQRAP